MPHWDNVPLLPCLLSAPNTDTPSLPPLPKNTLTHPLRHRDPIILPFFHSGMSRVMPFKSSLPRVGQTVVVAVGQPLDLSHITCRCNQPGARGWIWCARVLTHEVLMLADLSVMPPQGEQTHCSSYTYSCSYLQQGGSNMCV